MSDHYGHRAAHLVSLHILCPDQFWPAAGSGQVDLGVTASEHMYMGRLMIVGIDDDAQPCARWTVTMEADNLSR